MIMIIVKTVIKTNKYEKNKQTKKNTQKKKTSHLPNTLDWNLNITSKL